MILVADDEQAIRELMKSELMTFGYRVKTVSNGAEAVAMFRLHQAEVRLLITDNAMPVMWTGDRPSQKSGRCDRACR